MPSLTFLGAARTVTGSKYLLELDRARVLIDCGLFQGLKDLRERNWQPLPVDPKGLDAVVLTHAHIDHTGYLPRLVAAGYHGRIFCTPGTADLCRLVLPDAGRLQEEDARQANREGYSRHVPALPLFTEADAFRALSQLQPVGFERPVPVAPGVEVEFVNAGHLLGSAYARLTIAAGGTQPRRVLFGGDLGRYGRPILPDPRSAPEADVLLVESTYGDRVHEPDDGGEAIARIVGDTIARGGKILVPAFAIGRVEEVLYWLKTLEEANRIPSVPVFVDSPMAVAALKYYQARGSELDPDARPARGEVCAFCSTRLQTVSSPRQSRDLVASRRPAVVISSSGMATGGRVLHHLEALLPDPRHTVMFVGYQAAGTRGRTLVDGASEVKIHGRFVRVAARIAKIDSMSAHADAGEILKWLATIRHPPRQAFLVHGEPAPMDALKGAIQQRLGWQPTTPAYLERVELDL